MPPVTVAISPPQRRAAILTRAERLIVIVCVGCGPSNDAAREQATSHLRVLGHYYTRATSDLGRRPANEQELKDFITRTGADALQRLEIESVDALFVSERDSQPFVVLYGPAPQGATSDVVAYEQTGVEGRRQAVSSLGSIQEVDEAELQQLLGPVR